MDFNAAMLRFRRNFNKDGKGQKIAFMLTGGAYSTVDFRLGCGSSRFLEGCWDPYSNELLVAFFKESGLSIDLPNFHSVEGPSVVTFAVALRNIIAKSTPLDAPNFPMLVTASSSLTTNRYRRGENKSFVCVVRKIGEGGKLAEMDCWEIHLGKMSEDDYKIVASFPDLLDSYRLAEDRKVSQIILSLIMQDRKMLPDLAPGESVSLFQSTGENEGWLYSAIDSRDIKICSKKDKLCWAEGPA